MEGGGGRPICGEGSGRPPGEGLLGSSDFWGEVVMLCWSRWFCGLLVRTGACWDGEDFNGTGRRRAGQQVGFNVFFCGLFGTFNESTN